MEPISHRDSAPPVTRGFTLVELLVVLSIITVISGVVLTSQNTFNKTLMIANTAYDIALTLRSAEMYGISSRASTGGGSPAVNAGYGLDFQIAQRDRFTLFADTSPLPPSLCHQLPAGETASAPDVIPGDCIYNLGEKVMDYILGNGITISDFCAYNGNGWTCTYAHDGSNGPAASGGLTSLDITYARPNPMPFISTNGVYNTSPKDTVACVTISSPQGGARYVTVTTAGEIIANAASCP